MSIEDIEEIELDRLSKIFIANRLSQRGITFLQFVACPDQIIGSVFFNQPRPLPDDSDYYPLLPEQRLVQDHIDREEAFDLMGEEFEYDIQRRTSRDVIVSMHNGSLIESMNHKTYPHAGKTQHKRH